MVTGFCLPSNMLLSIRGKESSHYVQSPEGDKPPLVFVFCD